jgi:hypothetical protein
MIVVVAVSGGFARRGPMAASLQTLSLRREQRRQDRQRDVATTVVAP